jgi:hypothetical protein
MVLAVRIPESQLELQCGGLDWCYVYLEQRSEVMLLIKLFEAMGLRQDDDARIPCTCKELIYATPH